MDIFSSISRYLALWYRATSDAVAPLFKAIGAVSRYLALWFLAILNAFLAMMLWVLPYLFKAIRAVFTFLFKAIGVAVGALFQAIENAVDALFKAIRIVLACLIVVFWGVVIARHWEQIKIFAHETIKIIAVVVVLVVAGLVTCTQSITGSITEMYAEWDKGDDTTVAGDIAPSRTHMPSPFLSLLPETPSGKWGWFFDDNPEECFERRAKKCGSKGCVGAVSVGCTKKFSKDLLEKRTGTCLLRESRNLPSRSGLNALIRACRWNEKCGVSGHGAIAECLLNNIADMDSEHAVKEISRRCMMVYSMVQKNSERLGLGDPGSCQ